MKKQRTLVEPPPRSRDRESTERRLIDAAKHVLATEGFQAFGVNAIARAAGCDKQLIYRYFNGLEGLAEAIGADLATELAAELASRSAPPARTYAELMNTLALGLLDLMRSNRIMQQIIAWELAAPSPLVRAMSAARGRRLAMWMATMRGYLASPAGIDAPAVNAILIGGVQQLVLSAAANGDFSGLSLKSDADWDRVRASLAAIVNALYREA